MRMVGVGQNLLLIIKIVALAILFIATVVGYNAYVSLDRNRLHEDSEEEENLTNLGLNGPGFYGACLDRSELIELEKSKNPNAAFHKVMPRCPTYAVHLERFFLAFTLIFLMISITVLGFGCFLEKTNITCEIVCHGVTGIFVFFSGIFMLIGALAFDNYDQDVKTFIVYLQKQPPDEQASWKTDYEFEKMSEANREVLKFADKLAAGALAIVSGLLYFVIVLLLFMERSTKNQDGHSELPVHPEKNQGLQSKVSPHDPKNKGRHSKLSPHDPKNQGQHSQPPHNPNNQGPQTLQQKTFNINAE